MTDIDLERNQHLQKRIDFANRGLIITVMVTVVVIIATLGVIVAQNIALQQQIKQTLISNQANGTANHQLTREYIRCLAQVLQVPVEDRTDATFDQCNAANLKSQDDGGKGSNPSDQTKGTTTSPPATQPTQETPTATTKPTVVTGPPDPKTSQPGTIQSILNIGTKTINGLLAPL